MLIYVLSNTFPQTHIHFVPYQCGPGSFSFVSPFPPPSVYVSFGSVIEKSPKNLFPPFSLVLVLLV
uniref:Uncharacterized protein n=1 Tax=Anopheles minimus TaxID=112268 RepID=A0A182WNM8_9DIPT